MKRSNQRSLRPLVLAVIVLVVLALQVAPVAADSYLQCTRFSDKLVQGVAETGVPYLDSDDGYFYVVRGAQTGSVTRWLTRTPSSYAVKSGTLLGADSLSNMSYSDDIYWSVKSQAGYGQYNPSSYMLLGSTKLKGGSLSDLTSNNSQYMSFESYSSTEGQYGLKFNYTYYMDAGNGPSLDITGSFTLEFRIKWNTAPPDGETSDIVGKWDGGDGYELWYDYTSGWLTLHGDIARNWVVRGTGTSFSPLTLGTWYHVVFINDNGCRLLYVNGIRKSNESSNPINPGSTSEHLWIGGIPPVHNNWTLNYATLDEVAIWNVVRPEWKGKTSFTVPTEPYIGNEANLVGLWHLDEGTGSTAHDSTSNHNDAIARKRLGSAITTPYWVTGYPFASIAAVDFYGFSNTSSWNGLVWATDLRFNVSSVFVRVQLYNYTLGGWAVQGSGLFTYNSSSTPNLDEGATRTITVRPQDFRDPSTGAWGMRVSCRKYTTKPFTLGCDLVEYAPVVPGVEVELTSTLSDVNIRSGLATLNVTLESRCNVSSLAQNFYVFNYTRGSFEFWETLTTTNTTDNELHINMTTAGVHCVSGAGQMKIKINSTHSGIYVVKFDLVQWDLKYYEPIWEVQWRVDYGTTVPKSDITKLGVKLKSNLSRIAEIAYLSMYNYSASSWTEVIRNVNHTLTQTQWYNATTILDFDRYINYIGPIGYLNITMYVFDTNWTTIKSFADQLAVYVYRLTPDTTPPDPINNLGASSPTANSITLTWTATGDDGNTGTATGYVAKYSTLGPIDAANWGSATTYTQSWAPLPAGGAENHTLIGLTSGTRYWFAIKAYDEVPNYSGISNSPSASTTDITPPAPITDLYAKNPTGTTITLTWTAVGDDGNTGMATGYWVKYSMVGAITEANWSSATAYTQTWAPLSAGSNETYVVSGLISGTEYWFAVKAYDETPNYGGISNSPSASTTDITPPAAITDLRASNGTADSITLTWTAPGDDGNTGTAAGYVVKYSTAGPITASNWDSATTYTQSWVPLANGNVDTHVVSGLQSDSQYWFAVKAYDETPNEGGVSNSPSSPTRDTISPGVITDLAASNPAVDSISLTWTAPGDDGGGGTVAGYMVKYSTSGPITDENWDSATTYVQSWVPLAPDNVETHIIYGLNSSTKYWFAVKAYDETPNYSAASNVADGTTSTPQAGGGGSLNSILIVVIPVALIAVAGVGVVGLKVMGRSRQVGSKSPFRKRSKTLEGVARPRLREYVGESGVVPQPKKRAKFEEQGSTEGRERSG